MTSPQEPAASAHHDGNPIAHPPPLPPRASSSSHAAAHPDPSVAVMTSHDPRSSSTQSLVPDPAAENNGRRKLLLVYLHGFMGNETSFQSFPAHLHNLATITLAESHMVHTKIYPRYRSRNALDVARDDFSTWLAPHETPWTDTVLLGHSMGGLLAGDIALLFRHHIVGLVNFDVPFLGMHPGVVKAGLGSIFHSSPAPQEKLESRPSRMDTLFNSKPSDPNYNPSFYNDVNLPIRKGWENAFHFVSKHSKGLIEASKGLVKSHMEFGGAMANYGQLKDRYARIRALEEDNEEKRAHANPQVRAPPRIRFVNYYTASTGRPKKPKPPKSPASTQSPSPSRVPDSSSHAESSTGDLNADQHVALTPQLPTSQDTASQGTASPRISVEEHREDKEVTVGLEEPSPASPSPQEPCTLDPVPDRESPPNLPDIPPIPKEPAFVDLALYSDKAERRAAEKEHSSALKEYQRAVKARNTVIKERTKIEEKWSKQKEREREEKARARPPVPGVEKQDDTTDLVEVEEDVGVMQLGEQFDPQHKNLGRPYGSYDFSPSVIMAQPSPDDRTSMSESTAPSATRSYTDSSHAISRSGTNDAHNVPTGQESATVLPKKKRYKKFCMLPPKDGFGNKDPTWVRVFMENMDEVVAHTSLFFPSSTYERLVGDVGARIEEWITESESERVVREMQGLS